MKRGVVRGAWCVVALLAALGCRPSGRPAARPSYYDPAHDLGSLFAEVQLSGIFPDSKEFVDARPRVAPAAVVARYDSARGTPAFSLRTFVEQNFDLPRSAGDRYHSLSSQSLHVHIRALRPPLTHPTDSADMRSSLIPMFH